MTQWTGRTTTIPMPHKRSQIRCGMTRMKRKKTVTRERAPSSSWLTRMARPAAVTVARVIPRRAQAQRGAGACIGSSAVSSRAWLLCAVLLVACSEDETPEREPAPPGRVAVPERDPSPPTATIALAQAGGGILAEASQPPAGDTPEHVTPHQPAPRGLAARRDP